MLEGIKELVRARFSPIYLRAGDKVTFTVRNKNGVYMFDETIEANEARVWDEAVAFEFVEGLGLKNGYGLVTGEHTPLALEAPDED